MVAVIPAERVNILEQTGGFRIPNPPKIMGKVGQALEAVRKIKMIGDFPDNFFHISHF
jgi:hypothetical protein